MCLLTMTPRGKSKVTAAAEQRARVSKYIFCVVSGFFVFCYSQSFESMQRLCDKYNRAIDSIHQLVSLFV